MDNVDIDDRHQRELDRLAGELEDDADLTGLSMPELEEILYATRPPIHEGRSPSYGALIRPDGGDLRAGPPFRRSRMMPTTIEVHHLGDARLLADGHASFLARGVTDETFLRIYPEPIGDELSLVRRSQMGVTAVQRTKGGQVRVYRRNRVVMRDAASRWRSKPSARMYWTAIAPHLSRDARNIATSVLELCVHQLSATYVGATIVQMTDERSIAGHVDKTGARELPATLRVTDQTTHSPIRSMLSQLDRAVIVDPTGSLVRVNVTLLSDPGSSGLFSTVGGTRHHTALQFSASEPGCIVYVVSSDGPVTVFKAGKRLANEADFLTFDLREAACPKCGVADVDPDLDDEDGMFQVTGYSSSDPNCPMCGGVGSISEKVAIKSQYDFDRPAPRQPGDRGPSGRGGR